MNIHNDTRPVMQLVRELEDKVRELRADTRIFRWGNFALGVIVGVAITLFWLLVVFRSLY